jgi:hypothetical protein
MTWMTFTRRPSTDSDQPIETLVRPVMETQNIEESSSESGNETLEGEQDFFRQYTI